MLRQHPITLLIMYLIFSVGPISIKVRYEDISLEEMWSILNNRDYLYADSVMEYVHGIWYMVPV